MIWSCNNSSLQSKFLTYWSDCLGKYTHNASPFYSYFCIKMQRDNDKDHKVRLAIGNGVRAEVWREFLNRFGAINILEFYASTEGNVGFLNYAGRIGAVGRVSFLHRVRMTTSKTKIILVFFLSFVNINSTHYFFLSFFFTLKEICLGAHWVYLL